MTDRIQFDALQTFDRMRSILECGAQQQEFLRSLIVLAYHEGAIGGINTAAAAADKAFEKRENKDGVSHLREGEPAAE